MKLWDAATAGGVLTKEDLLAGFDAMKCRDEEYRRPPKGPCGCPNCVIGPRAYKRLCEDGGTARCANCFNFFVIPAPEKPPQRERPR